ncbi:MAG: response regulator transcription factor [Bacteroidetes bacterium]|nr:response regulator transcription factor [Bacteroidota bacterium]MBX7128980.1 response regulator transcription factor [Flavobacteriales bacterium]MCC6655498.1 response regulator transcription factor [Flavobacteriales bacterium]HMU12683.1 response regulator transcription factor [Flavobacteriales bacterium]HMW98555.1 response regulator transcription factor [Flavobacteriales bacterium]
MAEARRTRIIIVEDDAEIRDLTRLILQKEPGLFVAGSFANGEDFLKAWPTIEADVVLMDIGMPGRNGIECVAEAKPMRASSLFLITTVFENPAYIFQALCAGASGYLLKNTGARQLVEAIHQLVEGGSPMSPAIARLVVDSFQSRTRERIADHDLTPREKELIDGLAQGLMYKEIAERMGCATGTIKVHIRNVYDKLQVSSRHEAVKKVYPGKG